jgi:hypothetical protein
LQLKRLGKIKKPIHDGQLGTLLLSFVNGGVGFSHELVPVTVGRTPKLSKWQVRIRIKTFDPSRRFCRPPKPEVRKIELRTSMVPLEQIMSEVVSFYGPERRVIGSQLDFGGRRKCWVNPELLEDENFKGLARAQEIINNGCNEKQRAFFKKLARLYAFDLGTPWQEPMRLFEEIENFKKGFDVWL